MMRVLVIDIAASTGGALSILREYYKEIQNDKDNEYLFLLSDNYIQEKKNIQVKVLKKYKKWIPRLYFDYIEGKKIVKKYNPDIILSLQNTIIRGTSKKQILYMHQSIPFQNVKKFSLFKKNECKLAIIQMLMGKFIKSSIKKANKVIVQTNWIKDSVIKSCNILSKKIEVIEPNIEFNNIKKNKHTKFNKFFYPTSDEVYKNNDLIYDAVDLLLNEGISNFSVELTLEGVNKHNNVKRIGKLTRDEVFNKYSDSILVFPSYIETYGLPLLEARKSNALIFAADTLFAREVLLGYENAYFFDPFNAKELKELMKEAINNDIKIVSTSKEVTKKTRTIQDVVKEFSDKKSIMWLTNIPSPYRVNFFNELGKDTNLKIVFERDASSERDKSWKNFNIDNFDYKILNGIKYGIDKSISFDVIKEIKLGNYDYIFISNYSSITGIIASLYMICKKIPYIIETDGGFAKNGKNFKEMLKKIIVSNSKKCFSTSDEGDNYYMHYGASKENIVRYPFTSLFEKDILIQPLSLNEQNKLRKKYNIKESKVIISIGRFNKGKGFDVLLNAYSMIDNDGVGLYIVGGDPTDEYINIIKSNNIKNVHFIPFLPKEQILEYLKLSDLFVLATRGDVWGLVINEAMACGLPVITTDKCIAGLELIDDDKNGYIFPVDDCEELAKKINIIINDENKRNVMKKNNINKIKHFTFEEMSKIHLRKL